MKSSVLFWCATFFVSVFGTDKNSFTDDDYKTVFPNGEDKGSLKLVTLMFRHGNRTPDGIAELYPNDPHLNFTYFPFGHGQLTNAGKLKLYNVGVSLRNRYNSFLGKYYYPDIVEAVSTDYNRTKMSLELVLAGLFPPRQEDLVGAGLLWQPVPYNYLPRNEDKILLGDNCPKYKEIFAQYISQLKDQNRFKPYENIFNYLSENTGKEISSLNDVYHLYFGLSTEEEFGLELPNWTKTVWPEPITSLAAKQYSISMGLPVMRKLLSGYLLDKILSDTKANIQINGRLSRKIHLYSVHESTLAHFLIALGVFEKPHIPNYASYIILELHEIDHEYGFKIFYEAWDGRGLKQLKMSNCKEFCTLDVFEALMKDLLPEDNLCGN